MGITCRQCSERYDDHDDDDDGNHHNFSAAAVEKHKKRKSTMGLVVKGDFFEKDRNCSTSLQLTIYNRQRLGKLRN